MKHRVHVDNSPKPNDDEEPCRLHDVVLSGELRGRHIVLLENVLIVSDVSVPRGGA